MIKKSNFQYVIFFMSIVIVYIVLFYVSVFWQANPAASLWFAPAGMTVAIVILWKRAGFFLVWLCNFLMVIFALSFASFGQGWANLSLISAVEGFAHVLPYFFGILLSEKLEQVVSKYNDGLILRSIVYAVSILIASLMSSLLGLLAQYYFEKMTMETVSDLFLTFWVGDLVGAVILGPLFIIFIVRYFNNFINPRNTILYNFSIDALVIPKNYVDIFLSLLIALTLSFMVYLNSEIDSRIPISVAFVFCLVPLVILAQRCGWGTLLFANFLASIGVIFVIHDKNNFSAISYQTTLIGVMFVSMFFVSYQRAWRLGNTPVN